MFYSTNVSITVIVAKNVKFTVQCLGTIILCLSQLFIFRNLELNYPNLLFVNLSVHGCMATPHFKKFSDSGSASLGCCILGSKRQEKFKKPAFRNFNT